jgi:peptidoglycan/LPS O-acetylase OafA/YrhL
MVAVLGSLRLLGVRRAWIVFLPALALFGAARAGAIQLPVVDHGMAALLISSPDQWPLLVPFFIVGAALYIYRDYVPKSSHLFWASLLVFVASALVGCMYWGLLIGGTYAIVYAALSFSGGTMLFGHRVDLSYGVYLYGWPVAQLLLYFSHQSLKPLPLFVLTMAVTVPLAYASWRLVEAPGLSIVRARKAAVVAVA